MTMMPAMITNRTSRQHISATRNNEHARSSGAMTKDVLVSPLAGLLSRAGNAPTEDPEMMPACRKSACDSGSGLALFVITQTACCAAESS